MTIRKYSISLYYQFNHTQNNNIMTTATTYTAAQILSAESFQVQIEMKDLLKYGSCDFRADYEDQEFYDYETEETTSPDPDGYDAWVDNCLVMVFFQNGRSLYEIREWDGHSRIIWGEQWTGDDVATAADVAQAIADGVAEIMDATFN